MHTKVQKSNNCGYRNGLDVLIRRCQLTRQLHLPFPCPDRSEHKPWLNPVWTCRYAWCDYIPLLDRHELHGNQTRIHSGIRSCHHLLRCLSLCRRSRSWRRDSCYNHGLSSRDAIYCGPALLVSHHRDCTWNNSQSLALLDLRNPNRHEFSRSLRFGLEGERPNHIHYPRCSEFTQYTVLLLLPQIDSKADEWAEETCVREEWLIQRHTRIRFSLTHPDQLPFESNILAQKQQNL